MTFAIGDLLCMFSGNIEYWILIRDDDVALEAKVTQTGLVIDFVF